MDASKYHVGYFPVDKKYHKWVGKDHIEKPPVWCSMDIPKAADAIENAVSAYLDAGYRTADIMSEGNTLVGCRQCGQLIIQNL